MYVDLNTTLLKVPFIANLWCICIILLATLQSSTRGQEFFIEEHVTEWETIAREENEVLTVPLFCPF